jgi:histidyl-tRNA synthetase
MRALVKRGIPEIPETTAQSSEVSAHDFVYPDKLYYCGPMFRRERPQAGRLRQFTQFGVECVGSDHVLDDVQVIAMAHDALSRIGLISELTLAINSLGTKADREKYEVALNSYLQDYVPFLSAESRRRLEENAPLRILDSKDPSDAIIIRGVQNTLDTPEIFSLSAADALESALKTASLDTASAPVPASWPPQGAPLLRDFLSPEASDRFKAVLSGLSASNIPYVVDDYLLRGLDYYSHTAFEFLIPTEVSTSTTPSSPASSDNSGKSLSPGAYSAVLAGGRYDGLAARFGDKNPAMSTAIGWAAGLDRLYLHLQSRNMLPSLPAQADVCVVVMSPKLKKAQDMHTALCEVAGDASDVLVNDKMKTFVSEGIREGKQSNSAKTQAALSITALRIAQQLRACNLNVVYEPHLPFRRQLVQSQNAKFAVVLGEDEILNGDVVVKSLYERQQTKVPMDDLIEWIRTNV